MILASLKVSDGKESGSIIIKSDTKEDALSFYECNDEPYYAKATDNGVSVIGGKNDSNIGLIIGIVVAVVAGVAIVGVVAFMAVKKKACFAKKVESAEP